MAERRQTRHPLGPVCPGAVLPDECGVLAPIREATRLQVTHERLHHALSVPCPGCPKHLPIIGSSPRVGSRSHAAETYQPTMCGWLAIALDECLQEIAGCSELAYANEDSMPDTQEEAEEMTSAEPSSASSVPRPPAPVPAHKNTGLESVARTACGSTTPCFSAPYQSWTPKPGTTCFSAHQQGSQPSTH